VRGHADVFRRDGTDRFLVRRILIDVPVFWFCAKVFFFMFLYVWVRWTLPRFRYDQLMAFGWKTLLPLALANILVTALIVAWRA
jgi:NADH-quinone oxidoreductase subunit H